MIFPCLTRLSSVAQAALLLVLPLAVASSCAPASSLIIQDVSGVQTDNFHEKSIGYKKSNVEKSIPSQVRPLKNFHGHPGKASREFQLISSLSDWEALWPVGYAAPLVDFSKEMVFVAFGGEKNGLGHRFSLEEATISEGELRIEISEHSPAENCVLFNDHPHKKMRPTLILAFPKRGGRTRVKIRPRMETSCLVAPQLDVTCTVVGDPVAKFRNALPNKALPALGQKVLCTAHTEDGARAKIELAHTPNGAKASATSAGKSSMQFVPDVAGTYEVTAQASRGDGYVAHASVAVEAGIQTYEVELSEEEPEGLNGFGLEVWRVVEEEENSDDDTIEESPTTAEESYAQDAVDEALSEDESFDISEDFSDASVVEVCSENTPQKWCYTSSDGYAHQIVFPGAMGGQLHVIVSKKAHSPSPVAKLKISLAGEALVNVALSDSEKFWASPEGKDGVWRVAVVDLSEAVVTQRGDAIDRGLPALSESIPEETTSDPKTNQPPGATP